MPNYVIFIIGAIVGLAIGGSAMEFVANKSLPYDCSKLAVEKTKIGIEALKQLKN